MSYFGKNKKFYDRDERKLRRRDTKMYKCAVANNWFDYTRDTSNPDFAYTLLSGGVLNVPIEKAKPFLKAVADDMDNGYVPSLNEISEGITRLYMDLDFKDNSTEENEIQLFSERNVTERDCRFNGTGDGCGSKKFPAIVIEDVGLERTSYHNFVVVWKIAQTVAEYFPSVKDRNSEIFHVHGMWRESRFTTETNEYVNKDRKHVRETLITQRSFGMHLVWPNLHVTHEQALNIRLGVIRALAQHFTRKVSPNNRTSPGLNSWEDVIDENVYLPVPSLRMVGCDKYNKCPECDRRKKSKKKLDKIPLACQCGGSGKVAANSIYSYRVTCDGNGRDLTKIYEKEFAKSTFLMLAQCSIRNPNRVDLVRRKQFAETDPQMVVPANAPRYTGFKPNPRQGLTQAKEQAKLYQKTTKEMVSGARTYARKTFETLSVDSKEFIAVQNLFNNARVVQRNSTTKTGDFDFGIYDKICVERLRRGEISGNYFYIVDVCDSGTSDVATFCHNAGRKHCCEKNVYFKISRKQGIVQKCCCWSQKEKRPVHCQKYSSPGRDLPLSAKSILFDSLDLQHKSRIKQDTELMASVGLSVSTITKHREELQRRFDLIEVTRKEEELLKRYLNATNPKPSTDSTSTTSSCGNSPLDPEENARAMRYESLKKSDSVKIIDVTELEKTNDHVTTLEAAEEANFCDEELKEVRKVLDKVTSCKRKNRDSPNVDNAQQYARYKRSKTQGKITNEDESRPLITEQKHRIEALHLLYAHPEMLNVPD